MSIFQVNFVSGLYWVFVEFFVKPDIFHYYWNIYFITTGILLGFIVN